MGLGISIGVLADASDDPEYMESLRETFQEINRVLAAHGLPPHIEPESLPALPEPSPSKPTDFLLARGLWLSSMPYSWIHYLRRAVAFARQAPEQFAPLSEGEDPTTDARYDRELDYHESHLICHSDCEGYYVPIDFPEPLYDDEDQLAGGILGSSQRALEELILTAPLLQIQLKEGVLSHQQAREISQESENSHPYWIERYAWLCLFDNLSLSVQYKTAVVFH